MVALIAKFSGPDFEPRKRPLSPESGLSGCFLGPEMRPAFDENCESGLVCVSLVRGVHLEPCLVATVGVASRPSS